MQWIKTTGHGICDEIRQQGISNLVFYAQSTIMVISRQNMAWDMQWDNRAWDMQWDETTGHETCHETTGHDICNNNNVHLSRTQSAHQCPELSTYTIHINLNTILYTHVSSTYLNNLPKVLCGNTRACTHTHAHSDCIVAETGYWY